MKNVMIYAYTAHNLGDDLFIYTLCHKYPHTQFYLYAPRKYQRTFQDVENLTIFPNDTRFLQVMHVFPLTRYLYREHQAKQCDAGIYIGGSLFMEQGEWKEAVTDFKQMLRHKTHFFVLGANFGPYETETFKQTYDQLLEQCTDVCFRDTYSKALFLNLPHIRQGRDIVFELDVPFPYQNENTIIISVIFPSIRRSLQNFDETYFRKLAAIAKALIDEGYEVIWMAFCLPEQDGAAIEQILQYIPPPYWQSMHRFQYRGDIDEALQLIKTSSAVIATRFHAMILAALYHKPVFPIIYSNKMTQVLDDHNFLGSKCHLQHLEDMETNDILRALTSEANKLNKDATEANEQFRVLNQYMEQHIP